MSVMLLSAVGCDAGTETPVDPEEVERACPAMGAPPLVELTDIRPQLVRGTKVANGEVWLCRGAYPEELSPGVNAVARVEEEPPIPGGGETAFTIVRHSSEPPFIMETDACLDEPPLVENEQLRLHLCPVWESEGDVVVQVSMTCLLTDISWGWEVHLPQAGDAPPDLRESVKGWASERCS